MGRIFRVQGGPLSGALVKGSLMRAGLLTEVTVQTPSLTRGAGLTMSPQATPLHLRQHARGDQGKQLGWGGWGLGRREPLHPGQEATLKPELWGGEAGLDPGVLGAGPSPLPRARLTCLIEWVM